MRSPQFGWNCVGQQRSLTRTREDCRDSARSHERACTRPNARGRGHCRVGVRVGQRFLVVLNPPSPPSPRRSNLLSDSGLSSFLASSQTPFFGASHLFHLCGEKVRVSNRGPPLHPAQKLNISLCPMPGTGVTRHRSMSARRLACNPCRKARIGCDASLRKGNPCSNCVRRGKACVVQVCYHDQSGTQV